MPPPTSEPLVAEAHWPVLPGPGVLAGLAVGVGAAGARAAEVRQREGAARDERVARVGLGHGDT